MKSYQPKIISLAAVSLLIIAAAACHSNPASLADPAACIPSGQDTKDVQVARVVHIADGDTITVEMGGERYRVRYIGINTPELDSDEHELAVQASDLNESLVYGQEVSLYRDTSETDRYDRLLRYVVAGDTFINYELVRQGAARAQDYPPDSACADIFAGAQQSAQDDSLGLWADE